MKVKLKISEKQLNSLVYAFGFLDHFPHKDRSVKVARSVLDKVILKFKKKQLEVQIGANLFTKDKKHTFMLEYFEAHFLEQFTILTDEHPLNDYDRNVIRFIQSILNQQFAQTPTPIPTPALPEGEGVAAGVCPHWIAETRTLSVQCGCETTAEFCFVCGEILTEPKTEC